jgi:hypothetical protein
MATVNKNFKVKHGLVVEGTTGTINGDNILTESQDSQDFILDLIGGETLVKSVSNEFDISAGGELSLDRTTVDTYYDAAGSAQTAYDDAVATAASDATDKANAAQTAAELTASNALTSAVNDLEAYADQAELDAVSTANAYTDTAEGREQTNRNNAIANAISDLDLSNTYDALGAAAAAEASANSYTDDEISDLDLALKAYADQAESDAVTSANSYTDGRETAITTAYEAYADQAEVDAKAYADQKVTDLIGGAPGILDTLNELAAAIGDDADFITTIEGQIALKADLTYVNDELSDLNTEAQGFADAAEAASNSYTDGEITQEVADRNSAISDAISTEVTNRNTAIDAAIEQEVIDRNSAITTAVDALDTDDIEEGSSNLYFTNQRAIDAVGGTIGDAIDELTTDDIEEGATNQYFTDIRAKGSAADLIVNAIKTNITITGNEDGLTITAENGVADSTTTDLAEGTNQYFTEGRAKDAVAAALGDGIEYESGSFNVQIATGLVLGGGTGNQIEIDRTEVDTWYDAAGSAAAAQIAAEGYADGLAGNYEVAGAAAAAQAAAESYADGLAVNYDAAGSASTAESNANSYTDSLIGDNTVDGTSGNTVAARIASAVSNLVDSAPETLDTLNELAAALQDNPDIISDLQDIAAGKQDTLTAGANIDITGATISVTGLDTDDVSEGTNLYFTDARAVDALEAVVPNFTEVDINSVATQVAATGSATAATETTVYSFAKADYRSAKFLVKVAYSTHTEISEVLLTLDTSDNIAITEYAIVGTNGTLSAVSAAVSGANVNLLVTPTNTSTVTVMGTLLA